MMFSLPLGKNLEGGTKWRATTNAWLSSWSFKCKCVESTIWYLNDEWDFSSTWRIDSPNIFIRYLNISRSCQTKSSNVWTHPDQSLYFLAHECYSNDAVSKGTTTMSWTWDNVHGVYENLWMNCPMSLSLPQ